MTGKVIFYNSEKGFGFIEQDESEENIFFHISNCSEMPEANMRVQYAIAEDRSGRPIAVNVSSI